jgi:hypothetical protein
MQCGTECYQRVPKSLLHHNFLPRTGPSQITRQFGARNSPPIARQRPTGDFTQGSGLPSHDGMPLAWLNDKSLFR